MIADKKLTFKGEELMKKGLIKGTAILLVAGQVITTALPLAASAEEVLDENIQVTADKEATANDGIQVSEGSTSEKETSAEDNKATATESNEKSQAIKNEEATEEDENNASSRSASLYYAASFDGARNIGKTSLNGNYLNLHTAAWTAFSDSLATERIRMHNEITLDPAFYEFFDSDDWYDYLVYDGTEGSDSPQMSSISRTTTIDEGWLLWNRERYSTQNVNYYIIESGQLKEVKHNTQKHYTYLNSWKDKEYDDAIVYNKDNKTLIYRTANYDGTFSALWNTLDLRFDIQKWQQDTGKQIEKKNKYKFLVKGYETKKDRLSSSLLSGGSLLPIKSKTISWDNRPGANEGDMIQTTLNDLTTTSTKATGTAEPNADIEIKVGDKVIGSGKVDSNGNFSIDIPTQEVGTVVEAVATLGDQSSSDTTIVTEEVVNLEKPTIDDYIVNDGFVTGTAPEGATEIWIYDSADTSGNPINKVPVNEDGTYSAYVNNSDKMHNVGNVFTVVAKAGSSESSENSVVLPRKLGAPTINPYLVNAGYVKGTAPKGATTITVYDHEGKKIREVPVNEDGTYSVYVNDNELMHTVGNYFTVEASDGHGGKGSNRDTVRERKNLAKPTIDPYYVGTGTVTGTAVGAQYVTAYDKDNQFIKQVPVKADGTYAIYVNDNKNMNVIGNAFKVVAKDENWTTSEATSTVLGEEVVLKPLDYTIGEGLVTGSYEGTGVTKIELIVDGQRRNGQVNTADKTFEIWAQDIVTSVDQDVYVLTTVGGIEYKQKVNVIQKSTITAKDFVATANEGCVIGSFDGGIQKVVLFVDGKETRNGQVDLQNGTFKVYAADYTGRKLEVSGQTSNGKELARATVKETK
ncbi:MULTISPECIES: Ig-like domain-containing protein [Listeria]|uniref:Ig-like domain-containing protein n=1 Tax=Listeria TaxID=1637 RepID=UPI000B595AEF|nr:MULTISPECIES: Ig-like domain-containing protein [Listeria]